MRRLALGVVLLPVVVLAQPLVQEVNDVVVVRDTTGSITDPQGFPGLQMSFCRDAYNAMRTLLPDDYDGVVAFSTNEAWNETQNTWQGTPVREVATGIGRGNSPFVSSYNGQKLQQCVFMGTLGKVQSFFPASTPPLPDDPNALVTTFGLFKGLTGVEMLGHEYGHHWLMGIEYDMNDGHGHRSAIRGCEGGDPQNGTPCSPNQHYSARTGSGSVMYGSCARELDAGVWELSGCVRKYSHVDQYLMGLRAPADVTPMVVLDDGTGEGDPSQPLTQGATLVVSGQTPYVVGAAEIARAMGPRVPAWPAAQSCWRVAFVVVLPPGQSSVPPAMWTKVQAYRQRFTQWFTWATDGRGVIDTRLHQNGCLVTPPDAGFGDPFDAGTFEWPDASVELPDAGADQDAGLVETSDGGSTDGDGGPGKWDTQVPLDNGRIRPGCGCGADAGGDALALLSALVLGLGVRARRPRR